MIADESEFVRAVYNVLLDRDAEPGGLNHWTQELKNGLPRTDVLRAFLASAEFQGRMGKDQGFQNHTDVDLIIPLKGMQLRVPAADLSLVPHLLEHRSWEPHLTAFFQRALQPTDTFMDIGANLGYFTVLCASLAKRVIAFEPVAMTHRYCASNVALNALKNVELYRLGLWHTNMTAEIRTDPSSLMGCSISQENDAAHEVESIQCVALDQMLKSGELKLDQLDVIKMDVEGAEVSALQGMKGMLARFRPKVVMELNRPALSRFSHTIDDIWTYFSDLAYHVYAFEPWKEMEPQQIKTLEELDAHCPADGVIDILAMG